MKTKTCLIRKSLLQKLALVAALVIGGGSYAWGNLIDNGDGTFTENFVGYSRSGSNSLYNITAPTGWYAYPSSVNNYSYNAPGTITGAYHTTSPSVYSSTANSENYIVTPFIIGNFKLWAKRSKTTSPSVSAYQCTYNESNGTFTCGDLIKSITPTADYAEYEFEYSGDETRVALLISNAYIDDFTYTPYVAVGEIAAPTSLSASNPQPTSIDLNWTAGSSETTWQFSYGTTSGSLNYKSGYVTTNPYTLTGLTPNTTYYVSVRALNDVFSTWSAETSFTTAGDIAVTGVTVSPTSWEMLAGATKTLTATIAPNNATYKTVTWESDNISVATVSSAGVVTAVAPGSATITARSTADETKTATCNITVTAPVIPTGLKTKDLTADYTYLTWTNGSTETTWQIKYGTTSGSLNKESGDITSGKKTYLITGLSSNTTYYASIRSKLGTAYSAWSDELSFTTPAVGPASGEATYTVEDFETGWTVNASSLTGVKSGWGYCSGYSNFKLDTSNRHGDEGYGLSAGYNSSQYLITPALRIGSTMTFWAKRTNTHGYIHLYKAIKIGGNYYLQNDIDYINGSLTDDMTEYVSKTISEGGYVAIQISNAAIDDITYQTSNTVSAITDNNGYATFASSSLLDLTTVNLPDGLEAYKAKVNGTTVRFTEINQDVPANTGVLLKGNANTEYRIAVASESVAVSDNDFLVNSTGYTFTAEDGYTYFAMKKNSNPLTFATFAPGSVAIPTNKAYLKVLTSSLGSSARPLTFVFGEDDETTGIKAVDGFNKAGRNGEGEAYYNLNGQRISAPSNGLYIVNGKKVVVR